MHCVMTPAVHLVSASSRRRNLEEFLTKMTMDEDEVRVFNALDVVVRGARGACSAFWLFRSVACARECSVCIFDVEAASQALVSDV
jgi:hypothetical protein